MINLNQHSEQIIDNADAAMVELGFSKDKPRDVHLFRSKSLQNFISEHVAWETYLFIGNGILRLECVTLRKNGYPIIILDEDPDEETIHLEKMMLIESASRRRRKRKRFVI